MWLVGPNGNAVGQGANELRSSTAPGYTNELGAQVNALSPPPGAWTLIVAFVPQVSGTALTEPFTVTTRENAVPVSAPGLPTPAARSSRQASRTPTKCRSRTRAWLRRRILSTRGFRAPRR
jgi:hypothetical protein